MVVLDVQEHGGLERNALASQIYERILARITDRQLAPGQRLNIYQLARDLQVSITPVREALARLSSQHLVGFEPFRGYSVLPVLDAEHIGQLFHVRTLIETSSVCIGVTRATAAHIEALYTHTETMRTISTVASPDVFHAFNDEDRSFHHALVNTAGNDFLNDIYETLSPLIHIGRYYHERNVIAADQIIDHHLAIVSAYERRDAAGAEESLGRHLLWARERLLRTIDVSGAVSPHPGHARR